MCDKYRRILHTCNRFVRMWMSNESVTSVKNLNVFVTPVKNSCESFTSVICSFSGDAIIWKIKDGRRRPCFSTGTCTTRHWGEHCDQGLKKRLVVLEELRWQACRWEISLSPSREPNGQICRRTGIVFYTCTTRQWGKFHLNPSSSFWVDAITRKIMHGR